MIEAFIKILLLCAAGVLLMVGIVVGLTKFLGPDDLAGCDGIVQPGKADCRSADAIVAISGGDTDARTREAIRLYRAGWAPKLIFSGAALDKQGLSNAAAMRLQAMRGGVPEEDIIVDEDSNDTAGNAEAISTIVRQHEVKRLILVTSAYHQRRAGMEFGRALGSAVNVVNHPTPEDRLWPIASWWMSPLGWWLAFSELGKVIYVSIQGVKI